LQKDIAEDQSSNTFNIVLSSLGESISGYAAYKSAGHLTQEEFENLDALAY